MRERDPPLVATSQVAEVVSFTGNLRLDASIACFTCTPAFREDRARVAVSRRDVEAQQSSLPEEAP